MKSVEMEFKLTEHANRRMNGRRISAEAVMKAIEYGRMAYTRGACIYAIGRREVKEYLKAGFDLRRYEGVHVVARASEAVPVILTVYRTMNMRDLREKEGLKWAGKSCRAIHPNIKQCA